MYIESELVELKEKFTDNIIKDIIAFLNTNGGEIYIGINNFGSIIGINKDKLDEVQRKLSDIITSQIEPSCMDEVSTFLLKEEDKYIIKVNILKGSKSIYCIKKYGFSSKGCYVRIGSTCKEISLEDIQNRYKNNLIEKDYILKAEATYLPISFNIFKILLTSKNFHINDETFEKNFDLKRMDGKYNLMAELLSDKNMTSLIFVKFRGSTKASISQRNDYGNQSILVGLQNIKDRLKAENICLSDTSIRPRVDQYLYDMDAVNEALVNAFVHNDWSISEPLVSFFNDRLEITSHGGLINGLTINDFFSGISHPRNKILMKIFLTLGIVEHTGHGVPKIIEKYGKQAFDIHDSYINVTIPFNKKVLASTNLNIYNEDNDELNNNEKEVLLKLVKQPDIPYLELTKELNVSRRTISRVFSSLVSKEYIKRIGNNKTGYWLVIR